MPNSRDASPASHEEEHATPAKMEDEATPAPPAPPTLQVPEEPTRPSQTTRPRSPARLPSELQVLARVQEDRLDVLLGIVEELQATVARDQAEIDPNEPELFRESIVDIHDRFRNDHDSLIKAWPSTQLDHAYFKEKVASNVERVVLSARKLLSQWERKIARLLPPTPTTQPMPPTQSTPQMSRLPEIAIPTFTGDYTKWQAFKAKFTSLIRERSGITDLDRLHYLQGAVSGEAAQLIAHVTTTAESFAEAWKLLDDRYENKRLNVWSYMERIAKLKPMKQRKAASLMKMANIIGETKQALKSFGLYDQHNCYLTTSLILLLDSDTREHWEASLDAQTEFPTLEQFTAFLLKRATTVGHLERMLESKTTQPSQSSQSSQPATRSTPQPTQRTPAPRAYAHAASAQPTTTSQPSTSTPRPTQHTTRQPVKYPCAFCDKDHYVAACPIFGALGVAERVSVTKAHALCVNCLGHHNLRNCKTTQKCKLCSESHHTLLHGGDVATIVAPSNRPTQRSTTQSASSSTQTSDESSQR